MAGTALFPHLPLLLSLYHQVMQIGHLKELGTSLMAQWLELHTFSAGGTSLNPGWGTNILHSVWHEQRKKNDFT